MNGYFFAYIEYGSQNSFVTDDLRECRAALDRMMQGKRRHCWDCFAVKATSIDDAQEQVNRRLNGDDTVQTFRCDIIGK